MLGAYLRARLLKGLGLLLLLALPGTLLICVLHCSMPSRPHAPRIADETAFFLCDHGFGDTAESPLPLSPTLLRALVEGLTGAAVPMAVLLVARTLVPTTPNPLRTRLADRPPSPPPRVSVSQ